MTPKLSDLIWTTNVISDQCTSGLSDEMYGDRDCPKLVFFNGRILGWYW